MKTSFNRNVWLLVLSGAAIGTLAAGCGPSSDQPAPAKETVGNFVDDTAITTKVKSALSGDAIVKSTDIHVTTSHGIVQLSGTVDSSDQKSAAAKDATSVEGVKDVTNDLTVK